MQVQRYKFVVLTNATVGDDAVFNDWYTNRHVPDVLMIPGIVAAERFELAAAQRPGSHPYRYLAIYEIETDDLAAVLDDLGRRSGTDAMVLSPALQADRLASVFRPL